MRRRDFLVRSSQILMGSALLTPAIFAADSKARFQLALSQYSLRELLRNGSLDPLDFPAFTVDNFGIKAIDLWEGGMPKDKLDDTAYLHKMRDRADKAGTDLFLLMTGTLQASPKKAPASIARITKSLDRAQKLGCDYVRVFLLASNMDDAASAMKKLADEAAKRDVKIIIEPMPKERGREGAFLAQLHQKLNHSHLTLMPDFGKLKDNIYSGTKAMLPYSESISAKMHSFDAHGKQPDFDYDRLAKMIIDSDYKGYIAIEWEGTALKPIAGVKASQKLIRDSFAKYGAKVI